MKAIARCGQCNTIIVFGTDAIGRVTEWCPRCKRAPPPSGFIRPQPPPPTGPRPSVALADICATVREWRASRQWTTREASEAIHVSMSTISALENDLCHPTYNTCQKLERALHITIVRPSSYPVPSSAPRSAL